jgi:hypothetical protein
MLHITNGDSMIPSLREAGVGGEVLTWRDALHDGPVPADLSEEELDDVRARFFASTGWVTYEEARAGYTEREVVLTGALEGDEIVLWFEHDLYDQLQLIQILAWFAARPGSADRLSMICIDSFPGVERFIGLGQLGGAQLATLFPARSRVTTSQLELGERAWGAFRSPEPTAIQELIRGDTSALPFLGRALRRHLEQFPSTANGLSRSEQQILEVVSAGVRRMDHLFLGTQDLEEAPFLGDTGLWLYISGLASGPDPLLRSTDASPIGLPSSAAERAREVELTDAGRRVRRREADWIALRGHIDRWLGGVHLEGPQAAWRWDGEKDLLVDMRLG